MNHTIENVLNPSHLGVFAFMVLLFWFMNRGHGTVSRYDYLKVLRRDRWKSVREIQLELEKVAGGWLYAAEVCQALAALEAEEYAERRVVNHDRISDEFRLVSSGATLKPNPTRAPRLSWRQSSPVLS